MGLRSAHTRRCHMLTLVVLCAALIGALSPFARAAAPPIASDDWRYIALVELARAGLLDERDAGVYSSGVPVSLGDLSLAVERTIRHLRSASVGGEISVSGSVASSPGPLRLTGPVPMNLTISARQANLIARLVEEFGPVFSDQSLANLFRWVCRFAVPEEAWCSAFQVSPACVQPSTTQRHRARASACYRFPYAPRAANRNS